MSVSRCDSLKVSYVASEHPCGLVDKNRALSVHPFPELPAEFFPSLLQDTGGIAGIGGDIVIDCFYVVYDQVIVLVHPLYPGKESL